MKVLIIIVLIVLALFGFVIGVYNSLIRMIEAVKNNKKQIDIQLDRRFKVFESLINVVKKYMDYEQTTLKDVVALRNQAQAAKGAGDEKARIAAENGISKIASNLNVVFENYPDLKAYANFLDLQRELADTENKIQASRRFYNTNVRDLNIRIETFPTRLVAGVFKFSKMKFFEHENEAEREPVKVGF